MKILLLGATGRTGKHVLAEALSAGHQLNCLARKSSRIKPQTGLTVYEGNPNNTDDLKEAMLGCDGVITVLNVSRHSDFPWSRLRTPANFLSDVMGKLVPIAEKNETRRIITCSAWGVAETKSDLPSWFRWIIDHSNIGIAYQDHERQEAILSNSDLDWTIVRPVGLTNGRKEQTITESFNNTPKPSLTISRRSLAKYLVGCLNNDRLIRQKVVISK